MNLPALYWLIYLAFADITLTKANLRLLHLLNPNRSMDSLIDQHEMNPAAGFLLKTFGLDFGGWIGFAQSVIVWCIYILVLNLSPDFAFGMYSVIFLLHFSMLGQGIRMLLARGYKFNLGLSGLQVASPNLLKNMAGPDYVPARFLPLACVEGGCYAKKPKLSGAYIMPRSKGKVLRRGGKARKR